MEQVYENFRLKYKLDTKKKIKTQWESSEIIIKKNYYKAFLIDINYY